MSIDNIWLQVKKHEKVEKHAQGLKGPQTTQTALIH